MPSPSSRPDIALPDDPSEVGRPKGGSVSISGPVAQPSAAAPDEPTKPLSLLQKFGRRQSARRSASLPPGRGSGAALPGAEPDPEDFVLEVKDLDTGEMKKGTEGGATRSDDEFPTLPERVL